MATKNAAYYSCKFNRPETIKSHKTKPAAIKAAGDFGIIYESETDTEYQIHLMANNSLLAFSSDREQYSEMDFKMSVVLKEKGLLLPL